MTKQILTFVFLGAFLILISASASFAQTVEQQVAKIRQLYAATNKQIDAGLEDKTQGFHCSAWTVGGERDGQQWAGVGTMKTQAEFWFDGEPNTDEENGEPANARKLIRKIISTYAGADDLRSRSEYVFDEATGDLIFALTSELDPERKTMERRFYYQKGKLIRLVRDGKNFDKGVGEEDKQLAANALEEAKRLQNIFALIFSE